jgi:hypothetical protein
MPPAETVPTVRVLLVQLPPGVASARGIVLPAQTDDGPVMGDGPAFTVSILVTVQLVPPREYVIVGVPKVTPVTIPVEEPTIMSPPVVLQTPPGAISLNREGSPIHTTDGPMIGPGTGLTVTVSLMEQPVTASE